MRTRAQGKNCLKATALGASVRQGAHFFAQGSGFPVKGAKALRYDILKFRKMIKSEGKELRKGGVRKTGRKQRGEKRKRTGRRAHRAGGGRSGRNGQGDGSGTG
ncbi:UNVERIFIED_ORG: hypothetical protein B5F06_01650 [Lacrimispora saccharolytica]|nr:hypothetical protein DW757_08995 [Clostridium sp. AM29-11AC]